MVITVSNEFLLEYLLNNVQTMSTPEIVVKGQVFSLVNIGEPVAPPDQAFSFTVNATEGQVFTMPTPAGPAYNYTVLWGDGAEETITSEVASHMYPAAGTYQIDVTGAMPAFTCSSDITGSKDMITAVLSLGIVPFEGINFKFCLNLTSFVAGTMPDTSQNTLLGNMFNGCPLLTSVDLSNYDTAHFTNFNYAFTDCTGLVSFDHSQLDLSAATDALAMFRGCTAITDPAPEWWDTYPGIVEHTDCFTSNFNRANYIDIPPSWKGFASEVPLEFTITVTDGYVFTVPRVPGYNYNYYIEWGDGTYDIVTGAPSARDVHTYPTAGTYSVKIWGVFEAFVTWSDTPGALVIDSVESLGDLTYLYLRFAYCTNLTTFIGGGLANTSGVTSCGNMFRDCPAITTIDLAGLDYANVVDYVDFLLHATALVVFDFSFVDVTSVTNMAAAFSGCTALTGTAPAWWDNPQITVFDNCFTGDLALTNYADIPDNWKGIAAPLAMIVRSLTTGNDSYISLDGGETWITKNVGKMSGAYIAPGFQHIFLTNDNSANAVANMFMSHDYGATWITGNNSTGAGGNENRLSDDGQYVLNPVWVHTGRFTVTADGGVTYTQPLDISAPHGCNSATGQYMYVSEDNAAGYYSHDYGVTWTASPQPSRRGQIVCNDTGQYVLCTDTYGGGTVYLSNDYGVTFTATSVTGGRFGMFSSDGQYQCLVSSGAGNPYYSNDYGATWQEATGEPTTERWFEYMQMNIRDNGVIVVAGVSTIYISRDHGATWAVFDDTTFATSIKTNVSANMAGDTICCIVSDPNGVSQYVYTSGVSAPNWTLKHTVSQPNNYLLWAY